MMCRGTHGEVRDGSRDPWGSPGQVKGPSGRFGTGWGTLEEVRDGLEELRDGWEDSRGCPGRVGGPPGRVGGHTGR